MQAVLPCLSRRLTRSCHLRTSGPSCCRPKLIQHESSRLFSRSTTALKDPSSTVSPQSYLLQRQKTLAEAGFKEYPRSYRTNLPNFKKISIHQFRTKFEGDNENGVESEGKVSVQDYIVCGRITSIRKSGSKLLFVTIVEEKRSGTASIQVYVDLGRLKAADSSLDENAVKRFGKLVERGDEIGVVGRPFRTSSGDFSIAAQMMPVLLAPSLHMSADEIGPNSDYAHDRHVHMRVDPSYIKTLRARSEMISSLHHNFRSMGFVNVQTPILAASVGGAAARPFTTAATEFPDRKLSLRIAPELWLKKLIVGGLDRVYEIGLSFRNEGIDKTHNPEFTMCEFYATHQSLFGLKLMTEKLIESVMEKVATCATVDADFSKCLVKVARDPQSPAKAFWPGIDFFTEIHESLGCELPDLSKPDARELILEIFRAKDLPIPTVPTLPRLLDRLCSTYIEPRCYNATWISSPPECLSPLAKSMPHPKYPNQRIALRAELFIHNKEVVNCYEEENSPFEQRRKFVDQQRLARIPGQDGKPEEQDDEAMQVDEDYIRALEWGMPPTGGWGCGLDRLLMLMLGKERIEDVLTFGNLRTVTWGAGKTRLEGKPKSEQKAS